MSALEGSLEDVVALLERERRRVPMEAPWELTKAYAQLLIANGFARIGKAERGRELVTAADQILAPWCERKRVGGYDTRLEPLSVHGYLVAVFAQRFADACAYRPRTTYFPGELVEAHDALDRVTQYKVDRVAELTQTVSPDGRAGAVDPIGTWIQRRPITLTRTELTPESSLRELEPLARAERIDALLADSLADADQVALLDAFVGLPAASAVPVLGSVVAKAARRGPEVQAAACFVAMRFGDAQLAAPLFEELQTRLAAAANPAELVACVPHLLRAKRWSRAESDLVPQLERIWAGLPENANTAMRLLVAAGLSAAPTDLRASELVDTELERISRVPQPERLLRAKSLAAAATYAAPAFGRELLRRIGLRLWRMTTDSYGTNSHFCVSVLQLVEILVLAHVDLTLANLNVLDPAQQAMLTSGFAL